MSADGRNPVMDADATSGSAAIAAAHGRAKVHTPLELRPRETAIVVTDMINHQLDRDRGMVPALAAEGVDPRYYLDRLERTVVPSHQMLLAAARSAGMHVIYTAIGAFRDDYLDLNPGTRNLRGWGARAGTWDTEVIDPIAPEANDLVLIKTGSSSFHTSPLDRYLRNLGVRTVLYTGVITNGCVMASAISGFDLGYRGMVVADCTATFTPHHQEMGEDAVGLYVERIVTADAVAASLGRDTSFVAV
jgi:nicotinamidase-related amidase